MGEVESLEEALEGVAADDEARELVSLGEEERRWFERYRSPKDASTSRFCRIDALYRAGADGMNSSRLSFIEPNVVGLGGLCYAVDALEILEDHVLGRWSDRGADGPLEAADDPRMLLAREIEDSLDSDASSGRAVVALVASRSGYESDGEDRRLVEWMGEQTAFDAVFADPEELELTNGRVTVDGRSIDFVYRMMELGDLVERELQGADLSALQKAFEFGIVSPTVGGDLEHKSVFELFTNPRFARHFTPRQRRVIGRHVLWTRLLSDRETTSPAGREVELPNYVTQERRKLVLKPNRSYGGSGVTPGYQTSAREWEALVERAIREEVDYVVQRLAPPVQEELPVLDGSGIVFREMDTVVGIFPSRHGCGLLGRYAEEGVVNVSRSGGVVAYAVDFT